jgi:hypothetical protein
MADSGTYTPDVIARRLEMAKALLADPKKPITHWAEGLNELAKGAFGGKMMRDVERQQLEGEKGANEARLNLLGIGTPGVTPPAAATAPAALPMQPPPASSPQVIGAGGAPAVPDAEGVYGADATMAPPAAVAGTQPRGIRNNNPLNIEAGAFTEGQPGFAGSDGRFAKFGSPEQGIGAANALLDTYQNKHGLNTVRGIINRWAPPAEVGNNTSAYVASVAGRLGIDPDQPLTPEQRQPLIQAMSQFENGRASGGGIGAIASALNGAPSGAPTSAIPANPSAAPVAAALNAPAQPGRVDAGDAKTRIAAMLRDPNPYVRRQGAALADALVQKELIKDKPKYHRLNDELLFEEETGTTKAAGGGFKPLVDPAERAAHGIPADDKRPYQVGPGNKLINPPAETRVSMNTVANPIIEGVGKQFVESRKAADTAVTGIQQIHDARRALDQGAITGAGADFKTTMQKVGGLIGLSTEQAANTEVFRAAVGNGVLSHIKALGANPSNADREYIEKVMGGQIQLEEKSLRKILDIQEKYSRQSIKNFNRDSERITKANPDAYKSIEGLMNIQEPGEYAFKPEATAPATSPSANEGWTPLPGGARIREKRSGINDSRVISDASPDSVAGGQQYAAMVPRSAPTRMTESDDPLGGSSPVGTRAKGLVIRDRDHLNKLIRNADSDDRLMEIKRALRRQGMDDSVIPE